ncbi:MAG: HNH endonuclease [Pirellulales bacterium]
MPNRPQTFRPFGAPSKREQRRRYDQRRGTVAQRGPYQTKWWRAKRLEIARRDLYVCQDCGCDVGRRPGDFHCDHVEERPVGAPIDTERWDRDENLQTRCDRCHNRKTALGMRRGAPPYPRKRGGQAGEPFTPTRVRRREIK